MNGGNIWVSELKHSGEKEMIKKQKLCKECLFGAFGIINLRVGDTIEIVNPEDCDRK